MKKTLFATAMIAMAGSAMAQTTHPDAAGHDMKPQMVPADATLKWMPSAVLPKGSGGHRPDRRSNKEWRNHYRADEVPGELPSPAHTHPFTETITVISGSVGFGEDKIDKAIPMAKPGAVFLNPAGPLTGLDG